MAKHKSLTYVVDFSLSSSEQSSERMRNLCRTDVLLLLLFYLAVVKVKESRNSPGLAQRFPGDLGSQISRHTAHEVGEVSLTHRLPLPPGNVPGTHFH
jgi:hypothetical protein